MRRLEIDANDGAEPERAGRVAAANSRRSQLVDVRVDAIRPPDLSELQDGGRTEEMIRALHPAAAVLMLGVHPVLDSRLKRGPFLKDHVRHRIEDPFARAGEI